MLWSNTSSSREQVTFTFCTLGSFKAFLKSWQDLETCGDWKSSTAIFLQVLPNLTRSSSGANWPIANCTKSNCVALTSSLSGVISWLGEKRGFIPNQILVHAKLPIIAGIIQVFTFRYGTSVCRYKSGKSKGYDCNPSTHCDQKKGEQMDVLPGTNGSHMTQNFIKIYTLTLPRHCY